MAGYSSTPLVKKLGIREGMVMHVHHAPKEYFDWITPLPAEVKVKRSLAENLDYIHLFVTDVKTFQRLFKESAGCLKNDGILWVSWPKEASKVETDLDENIIRDFGLRVGLVDVKVCAVSEVWSGLKFVVRLKDRKKA